MIWQYPDRLAGDDAAATAAVKRVAEARASTFLDVIEDHLKANGPSFLGDKLVRSTSIWSCSHVGRAR